MIKCKNCGKYNTNESVTCDNCGSELRNNSTNKDKTIVMICVVLIAVVILFALLVLITFTVGNKTNNKNDSGFVADDEYSKYVNEYLDKQQKERRKDEDTWVYEDDNVEIRLDHLRYNTNSDDKLPIIIKNKTLGKIDVSIYYGNFFANLLDEQGKRISGKEKDDEGNMLEDSKFQYINPDASEKFSVKFDKGMNSRSFQLMIKDINSNMTYSTEIITIIGLGGDYVDLEIEKKAGKQFKNLF